MGILRLLSKVPGLVWLGLVVAAGWFLWLRQHDRAVRAEAQSEVLSAQVDTLRRAAVEDSLESARKDSLIAEQQQAIYDKQRELIARETAHIANTNRVVTNLRSQIDASLQPLLDSVIAGYESQLALKDDHIALEKQLVLLEQEKVAARDTTIIAIRKLNASLEARVEVLEDQTDQSLLDRAGKILPWAVGAYALGRSMR